MLEAQTFDSPDQILRRDGKTVEMELRCLDGLVAELVDISSDREPWRAFFDDERAHPTVGRRGFRVGFREQ